MKKILVVGQTPPPVHGQSIMIAEMLKGDYGDIQLIHVRMQFSKKIDEVGRFTFSKIIELSLVILKIFWVRLVHQTRVLYYPPAGPDKNPIIRDILILNAVRWMFPCTIFHFHAIGLTKKYNNFSRFLRYLFRRAYFFPEIVIHISNLTAEDGEFLQAKKIYYIPNGIEDVFDLVDSKSMANSTGEINLLYVGAVRKSKGIDDLLSAFEELSGRGYNIHLKIVGEPITDDYLETIKHRIQEKNIEDKVHLLGYQEGISKWEVYSCSDIFCFPTYYEAESFGIVLLEAMCFKLPILATAWRGIPSIVDDGVNGFLIPIKETKSMIEKLDVLINSPDLRKKMGEANRMKFLNQFTKERYISNLNEVFMDAINSYAN